MKFQHHFQANYLSGWYGYAVRPMYFGLWTTLQNRHKLRKVWLKSKGRVMPNNAQLLKKSLAIVGLIALVIIGILGIGVAKVAGKAAGRALFTPSEPNAQQIEEKLIEGLNIAAVQLNSKLPIMVDADTRFDRASVGPGARCVYHYSFPNYTSKDIDGNWLQKSLLEEVKAKICTDQNTRKLLQLGGIYVFSYTGSDGVGIAQFEIAKNDCGFSATQSQNPNDPITPPKSAEEKKQIAAQEASVRINKMFEQKDYEGIVQEYRTGNNFLVSDFNTIGVATYAARRYSFALNAFLAAESNYPNNSVIKSNLGDAYDALGDQPNALKKYREALVIDPKNSRARENIKRITPNKHPAAPYGSEYDAESRKEWKRQYLESVERQREQDKLEKEKL